MSKALVQQIRSYRNEGWNSLTSHSHSSPWRRFQQHQQRFWNEESLVYGLIALNVVIYLTWQVAEVCLCVYCMYNK
jgi:hypothetical protein